MFSITVARQADYQTVMQSIDRTALLVIFLYILKENTEIVWCVPIVKSQGEEEKPFIIVTPDERKPGPGPGNCFKKIPPYDEF